MEPQNVIYGLIDPRTKLVRYVGCSVRGMKRARQHGGSALAKDRTHKANWIRSLHAAGLTYEPVMLAVSTRDALKTDERWWVAYGRACGWPLTNLTDGGDGTVGWVAPPEFRAQISARFKGRVFTPDHLAKIAAANRGRKASPEVIEKLRRSNLGKKQSPETIAKRSAAMRGRTWTQTRPPRPAFRINLRPTALPIRIPRGPVPPEVRAKMAAAKRGKKQSPESVAKRAASLRGKKRTPEQVARVVAALRAFHGVKTHCPKGHPYTPENLRNRGKGPECRACGRIRAEARRKERVALGIGRQKPIPATCSAGHVMTPENTRTTRSGGVLCRICTSGKAIAYRARKKGR